ncbi:MAG: ECF transporter S component [Mogibacterium sp.]|nr:ECF transporter S component [Mogibacterium sp.]
MADDAYKRRTGRTRTQQLVMDALLAAMCVVLGFLSIRIGNIMKVSLEDFPVIFAAMMFGPIDGMAVAAVGIFLYQLLSYGITATTALWILPFVVVGGLAGWYAKKSNYRNTPKQIFVTFIVSEILICLLNTGAIYADSKIFGYYYPTIITGMILIRLVTALGKGVVLGFISPPILKAMSKITGNGRTRSTTGNKEAASSVAPEEPVANAEAAKPAETVVQAEPAEPIESVE